MIYVVLVGRLGKDPEEWQDKRGRTFWRVRIAVQRKEGPEWWTAYVPEETDARKGDLVVTTGPVYGSRQDPYVYPASLMVLQRPRRAQNTTPQRRRRNAERGG